MIFGPETILVVSVNEVNFIKEFPEFREMLRFYIS